MNQDRMQFKAIDRETKEVIEITGFTHVPQKNVTRVFQENGDYWQVANVDIIQSIGKRDKNNVLIFDGDILKTTNPYPYTSAIHPVSYEDCEYWANGDYLQNIIDEGCEVIGHKLTHPELLEKK